MHQSLATKDSNKTQIQPKEIKRVTIPAGCAFIEELVGFNVGAGAVSAIKTNKSQICKYFTVEYKDYSYLSNNAVVLHSGPHVKPLSTFFFMYLITSDVCSIQEDEVDITGYSAMIPDRKRAYVTFYSGHLSLRDVSLNCTWGGGLGEDWN